MQGIGLLLILLQFLSGNVSDSQSHLFGIFNVFSKDYSTTSLASSLNSIIGPVRHFDAPQLELGARSAIVIDSASGKVLFAQDPAEKLPIASITKLMTAVVAVDNLGTNLDKVITVPVIATKESGSRMNLEAGTRFTAHNLLRGMLVGSANDAAVALANTTAKDQATFIGQMNAKAKALGLEDTHFINPTGFDAAGHYSTAADLAKLTQYALANPTIAKIVAMPKVTVTDITGVHRYAINNTNQLVGKYPEVIGVKTGTTEEAGTSLITAARGSADQVIIVVLLDSPDRFGEGKRALDWALKNHSWIEPL